MFETDGRQILDTLNEEARLCDQLAALREEQRQLIDAGDPEKLLDVLASKQKAITRIGELEEHLKPVKADWPEQRRRFPAGRRVAIGEAFRKVRGLLQDLIAKETEDAEALAVQRDRVAHEMQTFDRKRQIETVYRGPAAKPESRYIDRKDA